MTNTNPNPTEDLGYAYLQKTCAENKAIWRRLAEKDIGVDGLIEMERDDGASLYIGVQVKSGLSYFNRKSKDYITIYLKDRLEYFSNLLIPTILVVYNPKEETGYWQDIQNWCLENKNSVEKGRIKVPLDAVFNQTAFKQLRRSGKVIRTPILKRTEVKTFLRINRDISFIGFVELAKHVINGTSFSCREGIEEIEFLKKEGLVKYQDIKDTYPGIWNPTKKGQRYIHFMLGDRYFIPFVIMKPERPIDKDDIDLCMDFEKYIAKLSKEIE